MDPFSLALGVLTVVQTSASAVKTLYEFSQTVKHAPDEIQSLTREANSLYAVLRRVDEALQEPKIAAYVSNSPGVERDLSTLKDPLKHCQRRIGELLVSLEKCTDRDFNGSRSTNWRWPFKKGDVNATRSELAQARDLATFAFSGLNFVENLRKNANEGSLEVERQKATPSPLSVELEELRNQGEILRIAARDGDVRQIKLLLNSNVPPDSKDAEGRTALSFAAQHGSVESTNLLIDAKAFVNAASNIVEDISANRFKTAEGKRMPLHWAAVGGHYNTADVLLKAGANMEAFTQHQRTPAMEAAMAGHVKTLTFLLNRGAYINAHTYRGWTMLHTAAKYGNIEIAELAISRGADVEAVYTGKWQAERQEGASHQRPIHLAVRADQRPKQNETAIVEILIHKGKAKISAQDSRGATPIHYAVQLKWKPGLELLAKHATVADLAIKDEFGSTALDIAKELGDDAMMDILKTSLSDHHSARIKLSMRVEETFP